MAGAPFYLSGNCRTKFSCLDDKDIHLIGKCCPIGLFTVEEMCGEVCNLMHIMNEYSTVTPKKQC